ncbi:MAG: hypothetical protein QXO71_04805 [Candidatus Jordarchaeaceae archaeon]
MITAIEKMTGKFLCYICHKETSLYCEDCGQPVCNNHSTVCRFCGKHLCLNCDY